MEILRALGSGSCLSLRRLTVLGLDIEDYHRESDLKAVEAKEVALALAEALEERREIGRAGLHYLEAHDIWVGRYAEATRRIVRLVAPTIEKASFLGHSVLTAFSAIAQKHPEPLPLKELELYPFYCDEEEGSFTILPLVQAMKEGKIPHLQSLTLGGSVSLLGQTLDCLIDVLKGGNLCMLRELDLTEVECDDNGAVRFFEALGNAAQYTQHVARLSFGFLWSDEMYAQYFLSPHAIQAFGRAMQQCGACPNLQELYIKDWDLTSGGSAGMAALLGTSLATPRLYEKLGLLCINDGSLSPQTMKLLRQFMASGGFPDLRELRLSSGYHEIGLVGLQHLVKGLKNCHSLEKLNLNGCYITEEGLRFLVQARVKGFLSALRVLDLQLSRVSAEVKEECRQSMKELGVKVAFDYHDHDDDDD
jgi:hypothetical protein